MLRLNFLKIDKSKPVPKMDTVLRLHQTTTTMDRWLH